jgi:hypothetical protein
MPTVVVDLIVAAVAVAVVVVNVTSEAEAAVYDLNVVVHGTIDPAAVEASVVEVDVLKRQLHVARTRLVGHFDHQDHHHNLIVLAGQSHR